MLSICCLSTAPNARFATAAAFNVEILVIKLIGNRGRHQPPLLGKSVMGHYFVSSKVGKTANSLGHKD